MSYFGLNSPLMFGINLWHVVKSTITRTEVKLEHSVQSKTDPCSILDIATKSNPVIETSLVCVSRYEVRTLSCQPLAASAILEICYPVVAIAEVESKELLQREPLSTDKEESSPIDSLLALDSLCGSTPSNYTPSKSNTEPTEIHPALESSSSKSNCSPPSFLAFLEASHLEMLERLRSEQPKSATSDLGCAQFNSAYYRRHPPPSLPQLKVHRPSKKPFCWKSKLDEIMRESGEDGDETTEESPTEFRLSRPSSSKSHHSRSSSISSDKTCVESPKLYIVPNVSTVQKLEQKPLSITLPQSHSQPTLDVKPIPSSTPSLLSPPTPSSFLAFLESSNLEMLKRMQAERSKDSTLDLGCAQFNSANYRRTPPASLPRSKAVRSSKKPFCWRTKLDQMMQDEECEHVSSEMVNEMVIQPKPFFPSPPHVRSASSSSNITCVEKTPTFTSF
ncbi:hypothetical protein DFH28DRAFT_1177376 [Melampsora americana]|nr:hypothetical protein DFH28DRAFT_1177376 [Melampsora americana]